MRPYWITTDRRGEVGITAYSEQDARTLLSLAWPTYKVVEVRPVRHMSDLDQNHVRPNMGNWFRRGIWCPLGYEQFQLTHDGT